MELGVKGKLGGHYLAEQYQKNLVADKSRSMSFAKLAAAKVSGQSEASGMSFEDMWQARFPGAYYHTADASNIPQGVWERNDFPFEKFFHNDLDEAATDWRPNGANPAMDSSGVQSRLHSIAGQKSIVVPPELEEKMKNDPVLAKQIMVKVENFIATNQVPGRICSHLIVLDENGEIARFRASSHGGNITGPTEAEMRQFEAEQAAKKKRREEYVREDTFLCEVIRFKYASRCSMDIESAPFGNCGKGNAGCEGKSPYMNSREIYFPRNIG